METAREFFKSIKKSHKELNCLQEEHDRLFSMLTSTTIKPKEVDVQTSISGNKMEEIVPKMMELDELIQDQKYIIIDKQVKAEKIIKQIDDVRYREILRWYYVQDLRWKDVEKRTSYTMEVCQRLGARALEEAGKYL